jgi:hypothetical protein
MPTLTVPELQVIERARKACGDLIDLARPRGRIAECKARPNVSSRAKWLLNEIKKLEAELSATNPAL